MNLAEKLIWQYLRKRQVGKARFLRQFSIDQYAIDFYCPKFQVAIEIDGESHLEPEQIKHDKKRQKYLESFDIKFLRFTNEQVYRNLDKVINEIEVFINILEKQKQKTNEPILNPSLY